MRFLQHFTRYQLMSPKLHTKLMAVILGSIAMRMRYDCNFNNHFSANLQKNLPVQELWKSVNIRQSYDHEFGVQFFGPPCSVLCCPTTVVIDCCGGCILQIYYWSFGGMFLVTSSQWTKQCQYQRYWTGITILELQLNVLTDKWLFPADLVSVCPFHFQRVLSSDLLLFLLDLLFCQ